MCVFGRGWGEGWEWGDGGKISVLRSIRRKSMVNGYTFRVRTLPFNLFSLLTKGLETNHFF